MSNASTLIVGTPPLCLLEWAESEGVDMHASRWLDYNEPDLRNAASPEDAALYAAAIQAAAKRTGCGIVLLEHIPPHLYFHLDTRNDGLEVFTPWYYRDAVGMLKCNGICWVGNFAVPAEEKLTIKS
jgi:hypothetical protein